MWIENGELTRRQFGALAALLAVSLAGCRRDSPPKSRGDVSRPSRPRQTETRSQTETRRQTETRKRSDTRRATPGSQAADDRILRPRVESP